MTSRLGSVVCITTLIAAGIAIVITTVIPSGYFIISYQYMIGRIDTHAEIAARNIEGLVMANPDTWRFEEMRLQELMQSHLDPSIPEQCSIVDLYGNVIAHTTKHSPKPIVRHRCDICDAGANVGYIEIARSLRPLLTRTMWVCAVSFLIGTLIFLVLRSIPLRAVREEQLRIQKIEIQNRQLLKAESLDRMAGAVAHHFNNQLYVVMGNLEMAIDDLSCGLNNLEPMTEALKASRKAAEMCGFMLTYLGQTPRKHEPVDLTGICHLGLSMLRADIPKNVTVEASLPSHGPTILANAKQIQQILCNLLTNARESICDNCGVVGLTVTTVSADKIPAANRFPINWQPKDTLHACMEITDTGCGIADKDIEKVFDPFFTTKLIGRGMGLSVVIGILSAHNGGVTVESEPGRGSVFRVFLPIMTGEILFKPEKIEFGRG